VQFTVSYPSLNMCTNGNSKVACGPHRRGAAIQHAGHGHCWWQALACATKAFRLPSMSKRLCQPSRSARFELTTAAGGKGNTATAPRVPERDSRRTHAPHGLHRTALAQEAVLRSCARPSACTPTLCVLRADQPTNKTRLPANSPKLDASRPPLGRVPGGRRRGGMAHPANAARLASISGSASERRLRALPARLHPAGRPSGGRHPVGWSPPS